MKVIITYNHVALKQIACKVDQTKFRAIIIVMTTLSLVDTL